MSPLARKVARITTVEETEVLTGAEEDLEPAPRVTDEDRPQEEEGGDLDRTLLKGAAPDDAVVVGAVREVDLQEVDTIAMTIEIATGDPTVIAIASGAHPRTIVVVMGHQTTSGGIHLTFVEVRPQVGKAAILVGPQITMVVVVQTGDHTTALPQSELNVEAAKTRAHQASPCW